MKVNFEKTDRLIEILGDSYHALDGFYYWGANRLKHSENPNMRILYHDLVDITQRDISEDEKHLLRKKAFAKAYRHEDDLEYGEEALKDKFDQQRIYKMLSRAYWQIQSEMNISHDSGNFDDAEGFINFFKKHFPRELFPDLVLEIVRRKEPKVKDIEMEFWDNCTDTDKINDWCDIYSERFKKKLPVIDIDKFESQILFKENEFYEYLNDLRLTGLLTNKDCELEISLIQIARQINSVSNGISELFHGLRVIANRGNQFNRNTTEIDSNYQIKTEILKEPIKLQEKELSIAIKMYNRCLNDVFTEITQKDFLDGIYHADFSKINSGINIKKSKLKFIVRSLNKIIDDSEWYQSAAQSIGVDKSTCSGANVPEDFKRDIECIIKTAKK